MTKIQVGDRAPGFSATTQDGQQVCLNDFLGKKALVLFFYPKDGTPVCTKEACAFRDSYEKFLDAGAEVIGVSSDSNQSHRAFADRLHLPFLLISDTDGSLRTAFGVSKALGFIPGRVTYVIDESGIVRLIFKAQFASEQHVLKALAAMRSG
jgi:thioredoxin-dependent peroxiredoxin